MPWADVVLSGAATADQLASNLAYADPGPVETLQAFAEEPDAYWSERAALPWI
jgi:hypothetical protein